MTTDDTRPVDPTDGPAREPRRPEATAAEPAVGATAAEPAARGTAGATAAAEPGRQDPRSAPAPAPTPDEATLAAIATPASVRRAPRFGAFFRTGVLLGGLLGWLLAILFSGTTGEGRTGAILLTTGAMAVLGALVAGGLAALADRRSTRATHGGTSARRRR